jgi:hypothetical protein
MLLKYQHNNQQQQSVAELEPLTPSRSATDCGEWFGRPWRVEGTKNFIFYVQKNIFALNRFVIIEPKREVQAAAIMITHPGRQKTSLRQ